MSFYINVYLNEVKYSFDTIILVHEFNLNGKKIMTAMAPKHKQMNMMC